MAVLQATGIADIVQTTINELNPLRFTDISSALQDHIVMPRLLKKNKVMFDGGPEVQWDLMTGNNGSAQWTGLFAQDEIDVNDVMIQAKIPWRHIKWFWAYDHHEISINSGTPQRIINIIDVRRYSAFVSAVEQFERAFWRCPASTNNEEPYGVPYYMVKSTTDALTDTTLDGFNGTVPSGYTTVANINPTTYPRWANYADDYSAITKDDLIRRWRRAATKTAFKPAVDGMPTFNTGDDYAFYTNYAVLGRLEELLESQNENLGTDVASMDGRTMFRRAPVTYVPYLDADTTGPIYGINWGVFKVAGLKGWWNKETVFPNLHNMHNVGVTWTDCSMNMLCYDRRRLMVLSTDTAMPA